MKALLKFRRRIEAQWAEQIQSLSRILRRIGVQLDRALQNIFNNDRSLIPAPVRAAANRRRFDRFRSRD
jgi:hypothetical protein